MVTENDEIQNEFEFYIKEMKDEIIQYEIPKQKKVPFYRYDINKRVKNNKVRSVKNNNELDLRNAIPLRNKQMLPIDQ